jgi:hypothetical protein
MAGGGSNRQGRQPVGHSAGPVALIVGGRPAPTAPAAPAGRAGVTQSGPSHAGPGLGRRVGRGCDAHAPVTPDRRSGMAAIRLATVTRRCEPAAGAPGAPHRLGGVGRLRRRAGMGASRNPAAVAPQAAGQGPPRPPRIRQHALAGTAPSGASPQQRTSPPSMALHPRPRVCSDRSCAVYGGQVGELTGLMSCLAGEEARPRSGRTGAACGRTDPGCTQAPVVRFVTGATG